MAAVSHASHRREMRRSERYGLVPSLHIPWTTLGAGRHVDLWTELTGCAHPPGTTKALVPGDEGLFRQPASVRGPAPRAGAAQRQRIDMIKPATMAPNPIAKFQAFSETMNGISSPAM